MNRRFERILLFIGASWNLITSLLTIFSYNTWFNNQGTQQLRGADGNELIVGSHLLDNVSKVIMTFGLFMFVSSMVTFLIAVKMKDNKIQKKILIWIGMWAVIQLVSMDIIGFVIFLLSFVIYISKNKAIKLANDLVES